MRETSVSAGGHFILENKIMGGCTLWARQTIDSEIFTNKPHSYFKIWFYLVYRVNHEEKKQFKRGTSFCKYEHIQDTCNVTKDEIKHCIKWLKDNQMLATQKTTRGFIITIINYDKYQTMDNYYINSSHTEATQKPHRSHTEATQKPHRSHTINKNDKNEKNTNIEKKPTTSQKQQQPAYTTEERGFAKQVLEYFNSVMGKSLETEGCRAETNIEVIIARKRQGNYEFNDFKKVIDVKWEEWKDDENKKYLTIGTLFCKKYFEKYRQQEFKKEEFNEWG